MHSLSQKDNLQAAIKLASEGRLTEAETMFARAVVKGNDVKAFFSYAEFLQTVGRLSQALALYDRVLTLADEVGQSEWKSSALNALATIHRIRGELAQAEAMYRKALEIDEALGRQEDIAIGYANLGIVYLSRGDLDQAKVMLHKSVDLSKQVGALERAEKISGLLATLNHTRGNPS
jgi:tetratricopeptide (TPR) repeat protein